MKIAVVGAGPSGLYLSILLKKQRPDWEVSVIEQNAPTSTFGFGIVLADSGLQRLRAVDEETYEGMLQRMRFTQYQVITHREQSIRILRPGAGGGAIARIDLLQLLLDIARRYGVKVMHECRIENLAQLQERGLADADVIVGADGVNSVVRQSLEQEFETTHAKLTNHLAWYGVDKVFPTAALVFRSHQGGHFVAHYYPYSASRSTFVAECDHATWVRFGMESMSLAQRQALFEEVYAPELAGCPLISNNSVFRQLPVIRNQRWRVGNVVLLGDAQTSAHPSIGSGTRIALEDAAALAEALLDDAGTGGQPASVLDRLDRFAETRAPQKLKLVQASEHSFMWYENMAEWMDTLTPAEFVYSYMKRTGRISDERLRTDYPGLVEIFRQSNIALAEAS